ncbi:hypothetical protein GYMLUDRAFT_78590 [Collybiopsis luxurians FD-317 M1]|uniref:Unplaced genomic scaffold GYMLUscaffold_184, whole genome shotgun sequence n=1 Tax=Collybiopsis luxurians FD-317 M1 TaxID=944289 RepID=A0A0D0BKX4_9AGAR|nr:hypothetical protein GYMLUDRAFT_78590 [Collybiopsis luxurians FD-317 M1]
MLPIQAISGEPLFTPTSDRFVLFPIRYTDIWDKYKALESCFWVAGSFVPKIDTGNATDLSQLEYIGRLLEALIAFDPSTLFCQLSAVVQSAEARAFLGFAGMLINIHSEFLGNFLEVLSTTVPVGSATHEISIASSSLDQWMAKWSGNIGEWMVALASAELIFGSTLFAALIEGCEVEQLRDGLKNMFRDRCAFAGFFVCLCGHLADRPSPTTIQRIITSAVSIELDSVEGLTGLFDVFVNSSSLPAFVQFIGDLIATEFNIDKPFGATNPFDKFDVSISGATAAAKATKFLVKADEL